MTNAQKYFKEQMNNKEFVESYNSISEQVDIEWELERVKLKLKMILKKILL